MVLAPRIGWQRWLWPLFPLVLLASAYHQGFLSSHWYGPYIDLRTGEPLGTHSNRRYFADLVEIDRLSEAGAVAIIDREHGPALTTLTGLKVVAPLYLLPTLEGYLARYADADAFFDPSTSHQRRLDILRDYDVRYVVFLQDERFEPTMIHDDWQLRFEGDRYALYEVAGR